MSQVRPGMIPDDDEEGEQFEIIGASDSSEEEDIDESSDIISSDDEDDFAIKNQRELQGDEDVRAEGDHSSDEEHERNTIGNVPLHWYDEFDHIGYDKSGAKVVKSQGMDEVDKYLASKDDPYYRRSVYDAKNDRNVVLTDRELIMVRRMMESKFPEAGFDPEPDYIDYYTSEKMITPMSSVHEPKRRFIPSKWERMKVMKIVAGIRAGTISVGQKPPPKKPEFYLMWGEDDQIDEIKKRRGPRHIPAPKVPLPGHIESYHPPAEYLPSPDEIEEWNNAHESERKLNYLPSDFGSLRKVPAYSNFLKERFERCLDLHMCARKEKRRLNIDPESLVPKLPKPEELRPYPTTLGVTYFGNYNNRVRSLAISPLGDLLASGGDDCILRIWEVESGRCLATYDLSREAELPENVDSDEEEEGNIGDRAYISKVSWNPNMAYRVIAVGVGNKIVIVHAGAATAGASEHCKTTFDLLTGSKFQMAVDDDEDDKHAEAMKLSASISEWTQKGTMDAPSDMSVGSFCQTTIAFLENNCGTVVDLAWHAKGEYLASVCDSKKFSSQVTIHHITKRMSQRPLKTDHAERVQKVLFHPNKPILFIANKKNVDVYHLLKQARIRQLPTGSKWVSSMAIHPLGDNLVVGSYDKRLTWFDLDMGSKPFKTLKYDSLAIRQTVFHRRFPLLASCADDGNIHVFHARVFEDFAKDPYVVPVKVLRGHTQTSDGLGVLDCVFHPTQPWIFTAGADGRVQLFQNLG